MPDDKRKIIGGAFDDILGPDDAEPTVEDALEASKRQMAADRAERGGQQEAGARADIEPGSEAHAKAGGLVKGQTSGGKVRISIYLDPAERAVVDEAAELSALSVSAYARRVVILAARRDLDRPPGP